MTPSSATADAPSTLGELCIEVWRQALVEGRKAVELASGSYPVGRTRNQKLRTVFFEFGSHRIEAIEQNPDTRSRWAERARQGERIMQFSVRGRYVGNVAEGTLLRYPAWQGAGLPD